MSNGLGFVDFQKVAAQLQSWASQFMGTKQKLFDGRKQIASLISQARGTGYVELAGRKVTLAELEKWYSDNVRLVEENIDLERKFLSAMEELKNIRSIMEASGEASIGIPGTFALAQGLDAVPIAALAWATGAAILVGSIAYFMSRVKSHLNNLAGATAGGILGLGTILLIGAVAYLAVRGRS